MAWLKIDDQMIEDEKIQQISHHALRLHLAGLSLSARRLTDGKLTEIEVEMCRLVALRATLDHVQELEDVGLWIRKGDRWEIKNYLKYNMSAVKVKALRKKWANQKKGQRSEE